MRWNLAKSLFPKTFMLPVHFHTLHDVIKVKGVMRCENPIVETKGYNHKDRFAWRYNLLEIKFIF